MPVPTAILMKRRGRRIKLLIQGGFIGALIIVALVGAFQLDVVREYFSRASGENANILIDTKFVEGPLPRPWRNLAQGGEGHDWRLQPLATQVKAINTEYVRLDHIYDFYEIVQGDTGNLTFNFSKLDVILDDIIASGAKPYIALSYMPPAISSGDIISLPRNWSDWQLTVQKTIEHVSGTRGIADVYYEVWNEPDLFGGFKYYGDKNYLTMYSYSAQGAANARGTRSFKIGGPAITALYKNWIEALARHSLKNNLRLDFVSWHRYSHDINDYVEDGINAKTWLQQFPKLANVELHITEWGHDSKNHPGYDTVYGATHTVAGSIEMTGLIDRAFIFEIQDGKDPAGQANWGRWGMFTHKDAGAQAKPRYRALQMLERLGNEQLRLLGKGTWVKALAALDTEENVGVVLANFDQHGRHIEQVPITFTNILPGTYTITKQLSTGQQLSETVATSAAALKTELFMPANSYGFVQLVRN